MSDHEPEPIAVVTVPRPLGAAVPAAAPVPGRSRRRRQITVMVALVVGVFVVAIALGALLRATVATRGPDGAIVVGGQLPSSELLPGDCFAVPEEPTDVVSVVRAQPCGEAHDLEAFHVFDSSADGGFPGAAAFVAEAQRECLPVFRAYVGVAADASELRVFTVTPSAPSWQDGDRRVVCAAYLRGERLTGSIRGSGR